MRTLLVGVGIALLTLTGCGTVGHPIDPQAVKLLQPGVSTTQDAINALGPPSLQSRMPDGEIVLTYMHSSWRADPKMFIPVVGPLMAANMDPHTETLTLKFTKDGILE